MIFPYINYTLHRKKHTHIENLKPPSKNYRHYRVKMNAYIENLNPQGSLPVENQDFFKILKFSKILLQNTPVFLLFPTVLESLIERIVGCASI